MIQIKSIIIILEEASYTIWSIKKALKISQTKQQDVLLSVQIPL